MLTVYHVGMNSYADVLRSFGGKLHVSSPLKRYVTRVVAKLPEEIRTHITSDCWFLGSREDAWAYTFTGDELAGKHLIILSDELSRQSDTDIEWTIMHEIGHVILGHRNSILVTQSRKEIARQEKEADAFARTYV